MFLMCEIMSFREYYNETIMKTLHILFKSNDDMVETEIDIIK